MAPVKLRDNLAPNEESVHEIRSSKMHKHKDLSNSDKVQFGSPLTPKRMHSTTLKWA